MAYVNETIPTDEIEIFANATGRTTGVMQRNISNPAAPPSSGTPVFYLAGPIAVGALGFLANGVVFILLCTKRNPGKNMCNALIHNQTVIDFSASTFLIIMYVVKVHGIQLTGGWGRFYCKLFDSNAMYSLGINASTAGLMVISVERYTKIVHSVLYRVRFRQWMLYVAMVFPWIYSVLITFPLLMATSDISNGRCLAAYYWSEVWHKTAYGFGTFIWKFLLPLAVFFFCYAKILLLIKEQSKIHASHSTNNGGNLLSRSEKNIVKTLLGVVGCYVFSYAPSYMYYLLAIAQATCCQVGSDAHQIVIWISFLNIVINPFIYAAKSDIVRALIRKIGKKVHPKDQTSTVAAYTIDT